MQFNLYIYIYCYSTDQPSDTTYTPDKHRRDIWKSLTKKNPLPNKKELLQKLDAKSKFKTSYDEQILTTEYEDTVQQNMKVDYGDNKQQFMYRTLKNISIIVQFLSSKKRKIYGPTSTQDKVKEGLLLLLLELEEFLDELDYKTGLMKHNQSTKQIQVSEFSFPQYNTDLHTVASHQMQLAMFDFDFEFDLTSGLHYNESDIFKSQNIRKTIILKYVHIFQLFLRGLRLSQFLEAKHLSLSKTTAPIQRLYQGHLKTKLVQYM